MFYSRTPLLTFATANFDFFGISVALGSGAGTLFPASLPSDSREPLALSRQW